MIRNLRCTVTIDSVLANSKTQNAFLFTVNAIFRHDYLLAVEPGRTPRPLVQKKTWKILYLLICSFLPCLSWLLRSRVRKSRRDLWITLYYPHVMETEASLPSSEQPITCPYPQPDESSHTHFNIVRKSMPRSSKWSSSIRFLHKNPVYTSPLPHTCYMPRPPHSFNLITRIIFGEENRSLSSSLFSLRQLPVTSFILGPIVFLSSLFSNTLRVRNQISRPHKQQPHSEFCVFHSLRF